MATPKIEINSEAATCCRCGRRYGKWRNNFVSNFSPLYKGIGYITVCRSCLEDIYLKYLEESKDPKATVRQMCRKLDLYWSEVLYESAETKSTARTMLSSYLAKLNQSAYAKKCYDDSLKEEGQLWDFGMGYKSITNAAQEIIESAAIKAVEEEQEREAIEQVPQSVMDYWGPGLSVSQYITLEQRRSYHLHRLAEERGVDDGSIDLGTDMLIRQIVQMEIDINAGRADGKDVNKSVNTLVDLLQKIDWKPVQKKEDLSSADENTPLGVWIYRFEEKRPLPEIDEDLKDVNGLKKYIFIWMGHLCKMLGIKGGYTSMYEEEIARLRVNKPEYDEDDDEALISDYYSGDEDDP